MREKCPRCGSFNIELFADGSGLCHECDSAFFVPIPEDAVIPEKKPTPVVSPDRRMTRSEYRTSPEWRRKSAGTSYDTQWQPSYGVPSTGLGFDQRTQEKRNRLRVGGVMVIAGSPFYLISIPVVMFGMLALVSSMVGRNITFEEFFWALDQVGFASIIYLGILMQVVFFIVALILGFSMRNASQGAAIGAVGFGIVAIVISFLWLGGIVAAVGGILALVGGVIGAAGSF